MKHGAAIFRQQPNRSARAPGEAEAVAITVPSERPAEVAEPLAPLSTRPIHAPVLTIFPKTQSREGGGLNRTIRPNPTTRIMDSQPNTNPIQRLTYSVEESALALGVSKPTIYRLIEREVLRPLPGIRHKRIPCGQVRKFASGEDVHGLN